MIIRVLILFFLIWNAVVSTLNLSITVIEKRDAAVEAVQLYTRFLTR